MAMLLALLAILANGTPGDFNAVVLGDCHPVIRPGVFIGCEQAHPGEDDAAYAGVLWIDGRPSLQTGP
jgi:hypothetical protein